jgi:hypothetical protein
MEATPRITIKMEREVREIEHVYTFPPLTTQKE